MFFIRIANGGLPDIGPDFNADLIGAIDKSVNVVFALQDACMMAERNLTLESCDNCADTIDALPK
jgi:hypothetical protein